MSRTYNTSSRQIKKDKHKIKLFNNNWLEVKVIKEETNITHENTSGNFRKIKIVTRKLKIKKKKEYQIGQNTLMGKLECTTTKKVILGIVYRCSLRNRHLKMKTQYRLTLTLLTKTEKNFLL